MLEQASLVRATIERRRGNLAPAGDLLDETEERMKRTIPAGHIGYAALASQGSLLFEAHGQLRDARRAADLALALLEGQVQDRSLLPEFLRRRASLAARMGDLPQARGDAERALTLGRPGSDAIHPSSYLGLAWLTVADIQKAQGDEAAARSAAAAAVVQLRPTLGPDHPDVRAAARLLGTASGRMGE